MGKWTLSGVYGWQAKASLTREYIPIVIPGACEYVTWYSKRNLADVIKLRGLITGKQMARSQSKRCDDRSNGKSDAGTRAKEGRQTSEGGPGREWILS